MPHVPLQVIETAGKGGSVSEPKRYVPQFQRRNFKWEVRNEGRKEGLTLWELHYTADFKGGAFSDMDRGEEKAAILALTFMQCDVYSADQPVDLQW